MDLRNSVSEWISIIYRKSIYERMFPDVLKDAFSETYLKVVIKPNPATKDLSP